MKLISNSRFSLRRLPAEFRVKRFHNSLEKIDEENPEDVAMEAAQQQQEETTVIRIVKASDPSCNYFSSGHVMINKERAERNRAPLLRSRLLDDLASEHAHKMALCGTLQHSVDSLDELKEMLQSVNAGENIQRGKSIREMHAIMIKQRRSASCLNIMSSKFTQFGIGTAKGTDGQLYMVQFFR